MDRSSLLRCPRQSVPVVMSAAASRFPGHHRHLIQTAPSRRYSMNKDKMNEFDIDETLTETFPASDSPSWNMGRDPDRELMKAIRVHAYGGPEVLSYDEVPVPQLSGQQVLVR